DSKLFSQVYSDNKLELVVHVKDLEVSVSSVNKHMYHFSDVYNITNEPGKLAQTMCMGLGYNRILEMISRENQNREVEK
ncbi:aminoacyl--tRNA ligase-related protein, partial [Bacillus cytotoxicus]